MSNKFYYIFGIMFSSKNETISFSVCDYVYEFILYNFDTHNFIISYLWIFYIKGCDTLIAMLIKSNDFCTNS